MQMTDLSSSVIYPIECLIWSLPPIYILVTSFNRITKGLKRQQKIERILERRELKMEKVYHDVNV